MRGLLVSFVWANLVGTDELTERKTSILHSLTWECQSLESVMVARRLRGCRALTMLPRVRTGNMATRYVLYSRVFLGDILNLR